MIIINISVCSGEIVLAALKLRTVSGLGLNNTLLASDMIVYDLITLFFDKTGL